MIVLDASVVTELLTNGALAGSIGKTLAGSNESFIVPHLLDIEVVSAIRGLTASQRIDAHGARQLFARLASLPAERYPHSIAIWPLPQTVCRPTPVQHAARSHGANSASGPA